MRTICFLILLTFGFTTKSIANQDGLVQSLRDNWHSFLPTALRHYPDYDSIETYQVNSQICAYEPSNMKRVVIWITGNAFMFDEPDSHHSLLRYISETTGSKIFALSHRKIPEFTYTDICNDIISSFDYLKNTKQLPDGVPVVLAGDSSGSLLVAQHLSYFSRNNSNRTASIYSTCS